MKCNVYNFDKTIKKLLNTFFTKEFLMFVFCGGMGTLSNFVFSLVISIQMNATLSYAIGYVLSLFVAYSLNSILVFKEGITANKFIKFIISYIPNFLILFTFVCVLLNIFGWNKLLVYALAGLFGLPVTYIIVKIYAFAKNS